MAPSTAPTVLQTHTAPPLTVSRDLSERHSARVGGDLGRHGRSRPRVDERCKACRSVGRIRCCATGSDPFVEFAQCKTDPQRACNPGSHCLPGCRTNHRVRCRRQRGLQHAQPAQGQRLFQRVAGKAGQAETGDGGLLDRFGIAQLQGLGEAAQVRQQRLFHCFAGAGAGFAQQPAGTAQVRPATSAAAPTITSGSCCQAVTCKPRSWHGPSIRPASTSRRCTAATTPALLSMRRSTSACGACRSSSAMRCGSR